MYSWKVIISFKISSSVPSEPRTQPHSSRVVSPTHSPILSSQDESLRDSPSFRSSKRVLPIRASQSDSQVEESLSDSRIHQELALSVSRESTSPVRSSYRRVQSPTHPIASTSTVPLPVTRCGYSIKVGI
jgi:hypothetical protein